jgi:hypothetical protein
MDRASLGLILIAMHCLTGVNPERLFALLFGNWSLPGIYPERCNAVPEIPNGYAQIQMHFNLSGDPEPILVTFGIETTAGLLADRITAMNTIKSAYMSAMLNRHTGSYTLTKVVGKFGPGPNHVIVESDTAPAVFGNAGVAASQNNAVLVRKLTGQAGRHNKGRMYLPPMVRTDIGPDGALMPATAADWRTQLEGFRVAITAAQGTGNMVILHNDPAMTPTIVTSLVVDPRIATQRRRLRP